MKTYCTWTKIAAYSSSLASVLVRCIKESLSSIRHIVKLVMAIFINYNFVSLNCNNNIIFKKPYKFKWLAKVHRRNKLTSQVRQPSRSRVVRPAKLLSSIRSSRNALIGRTNTSRGSLKCPWSIQPLTKYVIQDQVF